MDKWFTDARRSAIIPLPWLRRRHGGSVGWEPLSGPSTSDDDRWMSEALQAAKQAQSLGEVPVGAVVVHEGHLIGRGFNRREIDQDPLAHAEILAIRQAARHLGSWRLVGCQLYVTLEPCAMCAGAIVSARLDSLVYGASDPKAGFCGSLGNLVQDERLNHRLEVRRGVLETACGNLLRGFFADLRRRRKSPQVEDPPALRTEDL